MARRRDAGMSLVETLVGVALFGVIVALVGSFVVDMLRTSTATSSRLANVDQLRVALDGMTKGLRTAVRPEQVNAACVASGCDEAFQTATPSEVTFWANYGDAAKARLTTYRVQENLPLRPGTGRLIEEQRAASTPGATTVACGSTCTTRVLVVDLPYPVVAPIFTFADDTRATLAAPVDRAAISTVTINVPVDGGRDYEGTSVTSTVFLPNSILGR